MKKNPLVLVGRDGFQVPETTDALIWAKSFIRTSKRFPDMHHDVETMAGWFANAIMSGYDRAHISRRRRMKARVL